MPRLLLPFFRERGETTPSSPAPESLEKKETKEKTTEADRKPERKIDIPEGIPLSPESMIIYKDFNNQLLKKVEEKKDILISGPTRSGKSSTANWLIDNLEQRGRLVGEIYCEATDPDDENLKKQLNRAFRAKREKEGKPILVLREALSLFDQLGDEKAGEILKNLKKDYQLIIETPWTDKFDKLTEFVDEENINFMPPVSDEDINRLAKNELGKKLNQEQVNKLGELTGRRVYELVMLLNILQSQDCEIEQIDLDFVANHKIEFSRNLSQLLFVLPQESKGALLRLSEAPQKSKELGIDEKQLETLKNLGFIKEDETQELSINGELFKKFLQKQAKSSTF